MKKQTLVIATRESPLALWQANWVKLRLEKYHPHLSVQLLGITTEADRKLSLALTEVGGKGLFVKELEQALLDQQADIAVHSMKDVPMDLPAGLSLPVMCEREDPRDVFVSNQVANFKKLPAGSVVGTSSLRRQSQLRALRPDIEVRMLRGNVNTRLARLDQQDFAAIVLAAAGLKRLGLQDRVSSYFSMEDFLPAVGQGVLGIECREQDARVQALIAPLKHKKTFACVMAERAMCRRLGGGCHAPIAAYADIRDKKIELRGLVAKTDGSWLVRVRQVGDIQQADPLGIAVAEVLLQQGAKEILEHG